VTLRRLADRFPGCLRELDVLGLAELERRARALADGCVEAWMPWVAAYHRLARAALALKRVVGRDAPADAPTRDGLAELAAETARLPLDASFVDEVARPAVGRLQPLLLARVAAAFGVEPREVADALFPTRRPSPYSLEG
jgi:hypothetical protein